MRHCRYCLLFGHSPGTRLYWEEEEFVIIQNTRYLAPQLVAREHGVKPQGGLLVRMYETLKGVAEELYGSRYCLFPTQYRRHFVIRVESMLEGQPSFGEALIATG